MKKKYYTSFDSAYLDSKNDIIEYDGSVYEVISKNNYGYNTSQYYNNNFQEESEDQKSIRLAKEKAEKRNRTIDQILG